VAGCCECGDELLGCSATECAWFSFTVFKAAVVLTEPSFRRAAVALSTGMKTTAE
jgi:hypothetical protein